MVSGLFLHWHGKCWGIRHEIFHERKRSAVEKDGGQERTIWCNQWLARSACTYAAVLLYYRLSIQQLCVCRIVGSSETANFNCKSHDTVDASVGAHLLS